MLDRLLNQVNILEKGLDAVALKNDVIAGNIANADTTGYKSQSVEFETVFQEALEAGSFASAGNADRQTYKAFLGNQELSLSACRDLGSRTASSAASALSSLDVGASENNSTVIRMDGNNVDIDEQMTELAKNSVMYEAVTYSISKELGRIRTVINEGK